MASSIIDILNVLADRGIRPLEDDSEERDFPEIGQIEENETVYSTSLGEVLNPRDDVSDELPVLLEYPRRREDDRVEVVADVKRAALGIHDL